MVAVCGFRSGFQFPIGLIEQFLGFLSMTVHVPFVGLLGRDDFIESLVAEALRGGDVGVATGADIALRRSLRDGNACGGEAQAQEAAENPVMSNFH